MERIKMKVAVHLLLIQDNNILLLRRYNTGYEDGNYSLCAGHVDGEEVYYEAMIREAKEEINIHLSKDNLEPVQVMHRKSNEERIDYFFVATDWKNDIYNNEPDKCDELKWYPIDNLPSNTVPYIQYAIKEFIKGSSFTHFGW